MNEIIMLGTGMGITTDLYNTCFLIKTNKDYLLVDTGGSVEIINRLKKLNLELKDIHHIFISHNHTDHILGFIWILKKFAIEKNIDLTVYCNDLVYDSIIKIAEITLPEALLRKVLPSISFHILKDKEEVIINKIKYTFFDLHAKGPKQFGFSCYIKDKRLVFLGDEPLEKELYNVVENADYAMHEAFCLDKEKNIFHPYEKNHSTAKSACKILNDLNVKNVILYHTEESHNEERKQLYITEGQQEFSGNIFVPNDMEKILIGE